MSNEQIPMKANSTAHREAITSPQDSTNAPMTTCSIMIPPVPIVPTRELMEALMEPGMNVFIQA